MEATWPTFIVLGITGLILLVLVWKLILPFIFYDPRNSVEKFEKESSQRGLRVVTNKHRNRVYSSAINHEGRTVGSLEVEAYVFGKKVKAVVFVLLLFGLIVLVMRSCGA